MLRTSGGDWAPTESAGEYQAQSFQPGRAGDSIDPLFSWLALDVDLGGEFQLFADFYFHAQDFALPPTTSNVVWVKKV